MACGAARNPIDEVIAGRLSCREFSGSPVSRSTIEQILRVARFAPSGREHPALARLRARRRRQNRGVRCAPACV
ncbi:nitroreductase family protein [Bradyrhizobium elkanii]|uniref:nitroreductase family protein n=1 Tax=Bradyrhizobium elkanii TaxID=29448 RepID=UPI0035182F5E